MTIDQLIENFELLGDWEERYAYLIELGKKLPQLAPEEKIEANRVHGCQAMVWLVMKPATDKGPLEQEKLMFAADSDAFIVKGLIAVILLIFNNRTAGEILSADAKGTLSRLGLDRHLSPTRKNGLFAMVERIRALTAGMATRHHS